MSRTFNGVACILLSPFAAAFMLVFVALTASGQTLRSDREALSRLQGRDENVEGYLSRLISKSSSLVRGSNHSCATYSPTEAPGRAKEVYGKRTDAKVCAVLQPINSSSDIKFDGSDSANLCSPFWRDGVAPWVGNEDLENHVKTFGTKKFKPPSRNAMAKQGFAVMDRSQQDVSIKKAEAFRNEAKFSCCPSSGPEGEECAKAMQNVEIHICRDEASDKNPSLPDSCATSNGYYTRTDAEQYQTLMQMFRDGAKSKAIEKSLLDRASQQYKPLFESDKVKAMNIVPGEKVVSGRIVLSPYHFRGSPKADDMTIAHEFMHACSAIRKQLDVKHDTPTARASLQTTLAWWNNSSCEVTEATAESFGGHMSHLTMDHRGYAGCLAKMAQKSVDPKSSVHSPSACPKAKLEEAFADGMAMYFAVPSIPNGYPNRACSVVPSTTHAHGAEVMRCLVAFAPNYKKFLEETFNCPVTSAQ